MLLLKRPAPKLSTALSKIHVSEAMRDQTRMVPLDGVDLNSLQDTEKLFEVFPVSDRETDRLFCLRRISGSS